MATGVLGVRTGLSQTEQFRVKPEAVLGAEVLATAFPAGATQPLAVTTTPAAAERVVGVAREVAGVASADVGRRGDRVAQVDVVLNAEPGTAASDAAIRELRTRLDAVPDTAVGGPAAATLDLADAYERDVRILIPLILLLVGLILVALLRCLLAPVLLVLTVVATFLASYGASWLLFSTVLGFPALDAGVLLLSFLFLVALGVDYNIFLVTRAREDAVRSGTRAGMLSALRVTGGVITSAGILLAAVFAALGVLPLITLTQIGVSVPRRPARRAARADPARAGTGPRGRGPVLVAVPARSPAGGRAGRRSHRRSWRPADRPLRAGRPVDGRSASAQ
jgi:RND superfamily putative drug exporter